MEYKDIKVTSVEVVPAQPDAADFRKIKHFAKARSMELEEVTMVCKVYLESLPEPTGQAMELFIGDHQIRKYTPFENGIFFVVNDPYVVESLAGGEVCFVLPGQEEVLRTGVRIPDSKRKTMAAKAVDKRRKDDALPTKLEVLRKQAG
ncbi:MAG: hypothetical protein GY862_22125 [Gammaproteobacteria bacterium]|nr:hypothetical protein [Gammaproteobacteria bacterium]